MTEKFQNINIRLFTLVDELCTFTSQNLDQSEDYLDAMLFDLHLADFNHDNHNDIVFSAYKEHTIYVLLGNEHGSFSGRQKYSLYSEFDIDTFILVDVNNDTHLDVIGWLSVARRFIILLGLGNGSFSHSPKFFFERTGTVDDVDSGDLNRDGYIDLVITVGSSHSIVVWFGSRDTVFFPRQTYILKDERLPLTSALGDFDGDDMLDIAIIFSQLNILTILFGNQGGLFGGREISIHLGSPPVAINLVDSNKDGYLDIIVANADRITLLFGNGNGTFRNLIEYSTGLDTISIQLRANYLNNDQYIDLAVVYEYSEEIKIFLGLPNGELQYYDSINFSDIGTPFSLDIGDLNNDNRSDMAVTYDGKGGISILLQAC